MKFAFVADPLSTMNPLKDTSFQLMKACLELGHEVYALEQDWIEFDRTHLRSRLDQVQIENETISVVSSKLEDLSVLDYVFIRKDPPFDRRYFYTTLLLDFLPDTVTVINSPQGLRDWNEKLAALFFAELGPPTLITQNPNSVKEFLSIHKKIVLKPLDGHGGRGIHILTKWEESIVNNSTHNGSHKILVQGFVEEAEDGDKRILIYKGQPLGAILRKAGSPGELNNLDQGGEAFASKLNDSDLEICQKIAPALIKNGLIFVGIDLLGEQLTEVNVTSPTGLQELCRFEKRDYHIEIIEDLANKL